MITKAIGVDLYNQNATGDVSPSMRGGEGGNDVKPCVFIETNREIVSAYGIEPGAISRVGCGGRIVHEATPTLRSRMGDNQLGVIYERTEEDC